MGYHRGPIALFHCNGEAKHQNLLIVSENNLLNNVNLEYLKISIASSTSNKTFVSLIDYN